MGLPKDVETILECKERAVRDECAAEIATLQAQVAELQIYKRAWDVYQHQAAQITKFLNTGEYGRALEYAKILQVSLQERLKRAQQALGKKTNG